MGWKDFKKKVKREVNKASEKISHELENLVDEIGEGAKKLAGHLNHLGEELVQSPKDTINSCNQETSNNQEVAGNSNNVDNMGLML